MPTVTGLALVDVVIVVLVVGSVLGALRRRRGLLSALASGAMTALVCWLAAAAVLVWAPPTLATPVADSHLLSLVPPPVAAAQQAGRLGDHLVERLSRLDHLARIDPLGRAAAHLPAHA